jgi:hypothetical protein
MPDSRTMKSEPAVQPWFTILTAALALAMAASLMLAQRLLYELPDREPFDPVVAEVRFEPLALDSAAFAPLRLVGAWTVSSEDRRVGGISAVAVEGEDLVAITDSGVVIRFGKPAGPLAMARLRDLPSGPGDPRHKSNRDSEAIAADPGGRGWWVAFENRDSVWLYDSKFERALQHIAVPDASAGLNVGIEGLATDGGQLLLLPERGGRALTAGPTGWTEIAFAFPARRVSGAAALRDGSLLAIERRMTPSGLDNALVRLDRCGASYCLGWRKRLPLGPLDNVEAIATERLNSGVTRLWLMTDDDTRRPMRTLLVAADLPAQP